MRWNNSDRAKLAINRQNEVRYFESLLKIEKITCTAAGSNCCSDCVKLANCMDVKTRFEIAHRNNMSGFKDNSSAINLLRKWSELLH